ncbi:hypothetical protein H9W91_21185 [Streptomyces alfalfae]|uniref:hypothetical protein n=1 Tax=Streptomyces alfalfae TaxID=1642299 RepID=UPI001BAACC60|nr:hypothetical protein [Streptomyces alfalfae]QUI33089.1 hypothetical protein H9W91_21185 [Streptomyces alfalfae]
MPVRAEWQECRESAREDGLVPALTLLGRALSPGALPRGPGGHAVVPRALLEENAAQRAEAAPHVPAPLLGEETGLAVLAPPAGGAQEPPLPEAWRTGLAWLRLGASEALRDACVAYLAGRESEGTALLMKQMVKGTLAEVLIEHLEIEGALGEGPGGDAVRRLQEQITRTDRTILRLLGAHGFTGDGPGRDAYVSELLADVYATAGDAREETP